MNFHYSSIPNEAAYLPATGASSIVLVGYSMGGLIARDLRQTHQEMKGPSPTSLPGYPAGSIAPLRGRRFQALQSPMSSIRFAFIAVAIAISMASATRAPQAQGAKPAAPAPEVQSSNALLEISATRYSSPEAPILRMQRGIPDEWHGTLYVAFRNISSSTVRIIDEHWFYDYSIEIVDSSGKPIEPAERWRVSNENTSGVVPHASVTNLLPGYTHVDMISLSEAYPIKPTESYTIKIRRRHGIPTKDATGAPLPNPEIGCTLKIVGLAPK